MILGADGTETSQWTIHKAKPTKSTMLKLPFYTKFVIIPTCFDFS